MGGVGEGEFFFFLTFEKRKEKKKKEVWGEWVKGSEMEKNMHRYWVGVGGGEGVMFWS